MLVFVIKWELVISGEYGIRDLFGTADTRDYKRLAAVYDGDICTYR